MVIELPRALFCGHFLPALTDRGLLITCFYSNFHIFNTCAAKAKKAEESNFSCVVYEFAETEYSGVSRAD